jgi:acyl-coenzyme A thioesterase PaaI-like protein
MNRVLTIWKRCTGLPFGKLIFSKIICWKAPYFGTIAPRFVELKPGYSKVWMKKRRAVHNHIATVHAIALCNLCEIGAGTMLEASLPPSMRWLPRGMSVQYLKKAETDVTVECVVDDYAEGPARDVVVRCDVRDTSGNVVTHADITMYVSPRKRDAA